MGDGGRPVQRCGGGLSGRRLHLQEPAQRSGGSTGPWPRSMLSSLSSLSTVIVIVTC